jgi:Ca2+-binding EF-hand superfamily protein
MINAPELKKGLHFLKEKVSNEDIDRLVLKNDLDGDGYINYEEFLILMLCR